MRSANKYIVAALLFAASLAAYGQSSLSGKWHGTENNLPIVDLTIEKNAGQATGAVAFYVIKRNTDGSNAHVDGQAMGPMENLNYEPKKLSFDMHRSDGSLVSFRIELTDRDHARLFRTSDHDANAEGSGLPLVRVNP
ncbi:MAG: hypothetical protein ABSC65_00195 [Acidobacteriaceae bacterium]|jgi:hypothetical protein